jgi:hypothetical protein
MNAITESMKCPKCFSTKLTEIDNLHMWWGCDVCGYQGDGEEFDVKHQGRENVIVEIPLRGGWKVVAFSENGELEIVVSHDSKIIVKQERRLNDRTVVEYTFTNEELEKEKFYDR